MLADEIEKRWREYKFDHVEQPKYNILLPYVSPNVSNSVQILNSTGNVTFEFSGREKVTLACYFFPFLTKPANILRGSERKEVTK